MIYLKYSFYCT